MKLLKSLKSPSWIWLIIIIILSGVIIFGFQRSSRKTQYFPIQVINVEGDFSLIDKADVEKVVAPLVSQKDFFDVDLQKTRRQLQGLSWVDYAEVTRVWPNTVTVKLIAQHAVALIHMENDQTSGLVNEMGEIFYPPITTFPQHLPIFKVPEASDVLATLDFYQQMSAILQTIGLSIITIELNSTDSWVVGLSNGISLQLGDQNVLTRLRHFVKVYPVVFTSTHKQAQSVDMRYENGMAVAWR